MPVERGGTEAEVRRRGGRTGWSVQDHLDRDTHPVPEVMRWRSVDATLGDGPVARDRSVSRAFHDVEMERLWPRVWQMACHQDEIPAVGDATVYEIGDHSVVVVRVAADASQAYPNSCLHRGTKLCDAAGRHRELRCPFHGWTWHLDGTLNDIPSRWDFPQLDDCDLALPQYFLFPNLVPFGGIGTSLTYRFRPIGHDPNRCLFEVYALGLHPRDDDPARPRLEPRDVAPRGGFAHFPEFGILGPILDQDTRIMHLNQAGMRAAPGRSNVLGVYQESRIRHLHRTLDEFLAR